MTRQETILTHETVNEAIHDILDVFERTEIVEYDEIINKQSWSNLCRSEYEVGWDSSNCSTFWFDSKSKLVHDLQNDDTCIQHLRNVYSKCLLRKEFINKEEVTCFYYNAYPMYDINKYIDMLPEYKPQELPPLYELAMYNDVRLIYGPEINKHTSGQILVHSNNRMDIQLCNDLPNTYFHELAHVYDSRVIDIDMLNTNESETVAEFTACVLSMIYGIDTTKSSLAYISTFTSNDNDELVVDCMCVLDRISNILDSIITDNQRLENTE